MKKGIIFFCFVTLVITTINTQELTAQQYEWDLKIENLSEIYYPICPLSQAHEYKFLAFAHNVGEKEAWNVSLKTSLDDFTGYSATQTSISPGMSSGLVVNERYTPSQTGELQAILEIKTTSDDKFLDNNLDTMDITISDTVMARERGNLTGNFSFGKKYSGLVGQVFHVYQTDNISSVSFYLTDTKPGTTIRAFLYAFDSQPGQLLDASDILILNQEEPGWFTLRFLGAPVLSQGTYFIALKEKLNNKLYLGTDSLSYFQQKSWVKFENQEWQNLQDFDSNVKGAFMVRANFGTPKPSDSPELAVEVIPPAEMYTAIPLRQSQEMQFKCKIINYGTSLSQNIDINAIATADEDYSGQAQLTANLSRLATNELNLSPALLPVKRGNYSYVVQSIFNDNISEDNLAEFQFSVTDTVFARDVNRFMPQGIGHTPGQGVIGNIFHINAETEISSASVFFVSHQSTVGDPFSVDIYDMDNNMQHVITTGELTKTIEMFDRWTIIGMGDSTLSEGNYFVAVNQLSGNHLALGVDGTSYGYYGEFSNEDASDFEIKYGKGFAGIRLGLKSTLPVKEINKVDAVKIYPNPVSKVLNVKNIPNGKVSIFDISGKKVYNSKKVAKKHSINVANFEPGMYILQLDFNNKKYNFKIIIIND